MNNKITLRYEKLQDSAEHYNLLIWTVFSVGVALSLWVLLRIWPDKTNIGAMQFFMSILGFLVLFYCILAIESFGQKKILMYKILNKEEPRLEHKIGMLPFFRLDWLAEIILLIIFSAYVFMFGFIWYNKSLKNFGEQIIFLSLPVFVFSLILLFIVVVNWVLRPKGNGGNPLEKIRIFLFGNWLKSYDNIVEESLR